MIKSLKKYFAYHLLVPGWILIMLPFPLLSQYSYDFNNRCKDAYKALTSLRLDEAERYIVVEKQMNPDNNIPYLLESYLMFFKVFIGEEETLYRKYEDRRDKIYDRLTDGNPSSPYYRYSLAVYHTQWALARLKFSEFFKAAWQFRKAYLLLEHNQEEFPDFLPDNLYSGLFHIAIGIVPPEYKWAVNILGFSGSIEKGEKEIQTLIDASETNPAYAYLREEVIFYKTFIDINVTENLESAYQQYLSSRTTMDTALLRNPLMSYALARILKEKKMTDEAIEVLENRFQGKEYFPFYYLDYLTGYYRLQRLDTAAKDYLLKYVRNFNGVLYLKSAYQKLSWYYLVFGDTTKCLEAKEKILTVGSTISDDDKQARIYAEKEELPDIYLLKARLLSDGGYYQRALNALEEGKEHLLSDKDSKKSLEYYYRLARIYHEWGKKEQSIPFYEESIENGKELPYYYAANSALKLGNIYEERKDYGKALKYYRMALRMKNKEYKTSIDMKAKAGIQRIEEKQNNTP